MTKAQTNKLKQILKVLKDSQAHHEYCGWGDSWERECAEGAKLPQKLEKAKEDLKKIIKEASKK